MPSEGNSSPGSWSRWVKMALLKLTIMCYIHLWRSLCWLFFSFYLGFGWISIHVHSQSNKFLKAKGHDTNILVQWHNIWIKQINYKLSSFLTISLMDHGSLWLFLFVCICDLAMWGRVQRQVDNKTSKKWNAK
jgi:hypothetical protein